VASARCGPGRLRVVDTPMGRRYPRLIAGVMKWQTCQTQNLVGGNARVGSSPTAGRLKSLEAIQNEGETKLKISALVIACLCRPFGHPGKVGI
jgi:hypothetical protein